MAPEPKQLKEYSLEDVAQVRVRRLVLRGATGLRPGEGRALTGPPRLPWLVLTPLSLDPEG